MILTGEAAQLAGLENDLARLNHSIRELSVYASDATLTLKTEFAKSPAAVETLSKPLVETVNLDVAESSIVEAIVEEIGLHL